jgi:predicted RNase H-like HicB family nuclease
MKSKTLSILTLAGVLFAGASSTALASDIWLGEAAHGSSSHAAQGKTRAQVIAELQEARSLGLLENGELPPAPRQAQLQQERSRAEVRVEAVEAVKVSSNAPGNVYLQ